jgi:ribonuclease HI
MTHTTVQKIYTDGSCKPNPGKGGYAFIILDNDFQWEGQGSERKTTNNRMELRAVIEALKFSQHINIEIYSDSKYVINCAQKKWKIKINKDLWKIFFIISKDRKIKWIWVKGHSGDPLNTKVDKLAQMAAEQQI